MSIFAWLKIIPTHAAILLLVPLYVNSVFAQTAPASPNRPWSGSGERQIERDAERFPGPKFGIDPARIYSLAELIDFAQSHNPETRLAWERARAQAAALGVARSELYPTLAAAALSHIDRDWILFQDRFFRQTTQTFLAAFDLNYTVFDFGARAGRIDAARAEVLAANFAFNDTHRNIIYRNLLDVTAAQRTLAQARSADVTARTRVLTALAELAFRIGDKRP
jgi:outer membrane protein